MRLNVGGFGVAAGGVAAAGFTVCAVAVAIAPEATTKFFSYITHLDLTSLSRPLTWGSYIGGVVGWALLTALAFSGAAAVYNRVVTTAEQ